MEDLINQFLSIKGEKQIVDLLLKHKKFSIEDFHGVTVLKIDTWLFPHKDTPVKERLAVYLQNLKINELETFEALLKAFQD